MNLETAEDWIEMAKDIVKDFQDDPMIKTWFYDRLSRLSREHYYRLDEIISQSSTVGEIQEKILNLLNELQVPIVYTGEKSFKQKCKELLKELL